MAPVSRLWAFLKATRARPVAQGSPASGLGKAKPVQAEQSPRRFAKDCSRYFLICLGWLPVAVFVNNHVVELNWINGPSMAPLFNERHNETTRRDVCLSRKYRAQKNLQRGMVVTFL